MINPKEHPHSPAENISLNKESLNNIFRNTQNSKLYLKFKIQHMTDIKITYARNKETNNN
jgi:hypothetical protein